MMQDMTDNYTPTTEEVSDHWVNVGFAGDRSSFLRWLEGERAAAWDDGYDERDRAITDIYGDVATHCENPYRHP